MADAFTVGWTAMSEGTRDDYVRLDRLYRFHHLGGDRDARERHTASPYFDRCVDFCASYDQNCFDPHHDDLPLEDFVPFIEEIFTHPAREYCA